MNKKIIVGGVAAVTLVGGAWGVAQIANADEGTPTPSATAETRPGVGGNQGEQRGHRGGPMNGHRAMQGGPALETLADKLGVAESDLEDAMEAIRGELHPQFGERGGRFGMTDDEREARHDAMAEALAEQLGLDATEVEAALDEMQGERMAAREAEVTERLDQAVEDGKLTRAEADVVRKAIDEGIVGFRGGR